MSHKLLFVITAFVLFSSCKRDGLPPAYLCQLKQVDREDPVTPGQMKYTYNDHHAISVQSFTPTGAAEQFLEYKYDNHGKVNRINSPTGSYLLIHYTQDLLTRVDEFNSGDQLVRQQLF